MIDQATKLRIRRKFKRRQRQIGDIGSQTEEKLDRHFFRRLGRLYEVRRFVVTWITLIVLLIGLTIVQTRSLSSYYQSVQPLPGGIYSEGMVGTYTNASPIFTIGEVDNSVSRLLFASLFSYDSNNNFVPELAKSLSVDQSGKVYTVVLRPNLKWSDNEPLTADDVIFTFSTIQNPDVKSSLFSSWSGVKVSKVDDSTINFTLPGVLASFKYSLDVGIMPKHILKDVSAETLRSSDFNTINPVGSGPFKWHGVVVKGDNSETREQTISLSSNPNYFKGKPKLNEFVIHTFQSDERMVNAFKKNEITAMAGLSSLPDDLESSISLAKTNIPMTGAVMAFLNTTKDPLTDVHIRTGLTQATDRQEIINMLANPSVGVNAPFLRSMLGYDKSIVQKPFDVSAANAALDASGWAMGSDGIREKNGNKLTLTLNTLNTLEYANVAHQLSDQWRSVGVLTDVTALSQDELEAAIAGRTYDVLLYAISMGVDPDQFAYWHSSRADVLAKPRLNLSNYKSKTADASLEAGRTRLDPVLRAAKYKPFLTAWRDDSPAVALFQTHYLYITHSTVFNFNAKILNLPSDRYSNIVNWMIRSERRTIE